MDKEVWSAHVSNWHVSLKTGHSVKQIEIFDSAVVENMSYLWPCNVQGHVRGHLLQLSQKRLVVG